MYKSIQGCRALAALLVVLHHLGGAVASAKYFGAAMFAVPFLAGDSGVEFFFVLSGFIITWAHFSEFGKPANLARYLRKRIMRIYPTYWIVFAIVYCVAQASPTLRSTLPHDYLTLVKSLTLVPQDPSVVGGDGAPVLIVAWTLQYEICFYALVAIFFIRRSLGMLTSIALLLNFGMCHADMCSFPRSFFANNLVLLFALGALIAHLGKRPVRMPRPALVATIAGIAFASLGAYESVVGTATLPVDRRLLYGLLSGVVILALVQLEAGGLLRIRSRWMPLLGDSSYALYLLHYPLIVALCKLMIFVGLAGTLGAAIAFPVILCACVLGAVAFHVSVEKPILRVTSGRRSTVALIHQAP
jgi:peptidoglycan/LPS O-acetylase OafA/YrhL